MTDRSSGTNHTYNVGLVDVDIWTAQQHLHHILVAVRTRPEEGCLSILCETWRHTQSNTHTHEVSEDEE